jgi:hypothetical protein
MRQPVRGPAAALAQPGGELHAVPAPFTERSGVAIALVSAVAFAIGEGGEDD